MQKRSRIYPDVISYHAEELKIKEPTKDQFLDPHASPS